MASVLGMRVAGGLNDLSAREIISGIDPPDIIVVENPWADTAGGSDQERYNRMAQPWAGSAYTLVDTEACEPSLPLHIDNLRYPTRLAAHHHSVN